MLEQNSILNWILCAENVFRSEAHLQERRGVRVTEIYTNVLVIDIYSRSRAGICLIMLFVCCLSTAEFQLNVIDQVYSATVSKWMKVGMGKWVDIQNCKVFDDKTRALSEIDVIANNTNKKLVYWLTDESAVEVSSLESNRIESNQWLFSSSLFLGSH